MPIKRNKRETKMLKWSKMKKSEFQHVVYATVETIPSVLRRRGSVHRHVSQGSKQASVNKSRVALPPATVQLCSIGLVCVWEAGFRGHSFLSVRTAWGRHTGHLAVRLHALLWGFVHCVIVTFGQEITRGCKSRRIALHAESFITEIYL